MRIGAVVVGALIALGGCVGSGSRAVDGDTVEVRLGAEEVTVRLIGVDTPERGDCGYADAKEFVRAAVVGRPVVLVRSARVANEDRFGRLLRYVVVGSRDLGERLLREGLANARYDSLDGYPRHAKQNEYRDLDARTPHICPELD
jgi:endonuclease YncB( thermonuclease family)